MKTIYIMLSKTESVFCSLITSYTHEPYAHVSLLFDDDFSNGYSFSRKKIRNPFIGGFMNENYPRWVAAFPKTECLMYTLDVTDESYHLLKQQIEDFKSEQKKYKYNTLGVISYMFNVKLHPKNSYFCSHFVSYILREAKALYFDKDPFFTTAGDFRRHPDLHLIYEGYLNKLVDNPALARAA